MVHLGAHLLPHQLLGLQAEHVDLGVTMAHVAHDAAVLHLVHVVARDHVLVAGRSDHDVDPLDDFSQLHNLDGMKRVFESGHPQRWQL